MRKEVILNWTEGQFIKQIDPVGLNTSFYSTNPVVLLEYDSHRLMGKSLRLDYEDGKMMTTVDIAPEFEGMFDTYEVYPDFVVHESLKLDDTIIVTSASLVSLSLVAPNREVPIVWSDDDERARSKALFKLLLGIVLVLLAVLLFMRM